MSENLVKGQGTYHRTDMLPDSGDEANNLWARYLAENAEFNFAHAVQQLYSVGTSMADPNNNAFYAGAIGTFDMFGVIASGGTWVYSLDGTGGTITSGQSKQTVVLGTSLQLGWVHPVSSLNTGAIVYGAVYGRR